MCTSDQRVAVREEEEKREEKDCAVLRSVVGAVSAVSTTQLV